jgi:hypothetical protein
MKGGLDTFVASSLELTERWACFNTNRKLFGPQS